MDTSPCPDLACHDWENCDNLLDPGAIVANQDINKNIFRKKDTSIHKQGSRFFAKMPPVLS